MAERRVVGRDAAGRYAAVTVFNRPVYESHAALVAAVAERAGAAAAGLFARPELRAGTLVWTTAQSGAIRRYMELPSAERSRHDDMRTALHAQLEAIAAPAAGQATVKGRSFAAHLLRAALVVPSAEHLFVVGDTLVLIFWGFRQHDGGGMDPLASALPEPAAIVRRSWRVAVPLGLLPLLLLAGVALWRPVRTPDLPPVVTAAPPDPPSGTPPPAPVPPAGAPAPVPPVELPASPPLAPAEPEPPPPPSPSPGPAKPAAVLAPGRAQGAEMKVPANGDLSGLQGCWTTNKFSYGAGRQPSHSVYCFDGQGRGRMTSYSGHSTCSAPAHVALGAAGTMTLIDADSRCSDGSLWLQDRLHCQADANGVAHCSGQADDGSKWTSTLRRQ